MSDQDSTIFGNPSEDQQAQPASNPQDVKVAEASPVDPYVDLLKGITTEDGRAKYATVSDALNSIPHAQQHISQLEAELAELKAQAKEQQAYNEASRLENQQVQQEAAFGEDQVVGLLDQVLSQREAQASRAQNIQSTVGALVEKFGSKEAAEEAYNKKAAEMGVSVEMFNEIAATSPQAILAYFGSTGASAPKQTSGTLSTEGTLDKPAERRSVVRGASTKEMIESFRAHKPA